jgi:hypothetical protein
VVPLLLAAAVIFALVVLLTGDDEATVSRAQLTVGQVVADPEAYAGRQVVLRGSVAEIPDAVPDGSEGAFVLTDDGGGRLLVIPGTRGLTADLQEGASVHVSGVVTAPGPAVEEGRPDPPPRTLGDLQVATGADAIVEAVEVAPG